jgi:hypothetical protein
MISAEGGTSVIEGRFDGQTHRMSINGKVEYESPQLVALLESETLRIESVQPGPEAEDGQALSLDSAASMYTLWRGLKSMPQLPQAKVPGTLIAHPGYMEQ